MDVEALSECEFEITIIGLPGYDLCVGALEIGFEHHITWIRNEELPDVGQNYARLHLRPSFSFKDFEYEEHPDCGGKRGCEHYEEEA
jgi:hypothetical protein